MMLDQEARVQFCDSSGNEKFSLKKRDVDAILSARDKVHIIHEVEASYDLLIVAFIDFKSLVYKKTLESALWDINDYRGGHDLRVTLNMALASVLNAGKFLADKLGGLDSKSPLSLLSNNKKGRSVRSLVSNSIRNVYESSDDYFLMYLSRNFLQHNGLIIERIKSQITKRHDGLYERRLSLLLDLVSLKRAFEDGKFLNQRKLDRLNSIEEPVHILVALEGYISSIKKVIDVFRRESYPVYESELKKHQEAVRSILSDVEKSIGKRENLISYLYATSEWDGEPLPLSLDGELVNYLKRKNANPPLDVGGLVNSLDLGRKSGYYDAFYESLGMSKSN